MYNVELFLAQKLEEHVTHDLELFPCNLHVTCRLSKLLIQVDKEYNETASYFKGHGADYLDYRLRYCSGRHYLPVIYVCGGNRQDSVFEGALPVYDGLDDMLAFTYKCY